MYEIYVLSTCTFSHCFCHGFFEMITFFVDFMAEVILANTTPKFDNEKQMRNLRVKQKG